MINVHFSRKILPIVPAIVLAGALLLAACAGGAAAEPLPAVELQPQPEVVSAEVEVQADEAALSEVGEEPAVDNSSEANVAVDDSSAAIGEEGRTVPVLVLGDPALRGTDPSTVSLASGRIQFLEFFAYWCPTCKRMAPTVHGLEDIYGEEINFVYLDRDDPATASFRETLGYVYQPHYFLLNPDGIVLGEWVGYVDGAILQDAIELALQNASG